MMTLNPEPIATPHVVMCPACKFLLEGRHLQDGRVVYLHWYPSDYIIEDVPGFYFCINNAAMFLVGDGATLVRMEPIP